MARHKWFYCDWCEDHGLHRTDPRKKVVILKKKFTVCDECFNFYDKEEYDKLIVSLFGHLVENEK